MKKKSIIIVLVFLISIAGIIYYFLPYFSKQDLSRYVPADAILTMKLNVVQISEKIDTKEIKDLRIFNNEFMDELNSSDRDKMKELMQNPLKCGIELRTAPVYSLYQQSENEPVGVLLLGITDATDFKNFVMVMSDDWSVKELDDAGFYEVLVDDEYSKFYFNDDIAMWIVDIDQNEISLQQVRDELVELDNANSILTNASYTRMNDQGNDFMLYLNKSELSDLIKKNKSSKAGKRQSEMLVLSYLPEAMSLDFIDDAITIKAYSSDDSNPMKVLKDEGISDGDLKNISPGSNPFAFISANMHLDKLIDVTLDAAEIQDESARDDFNMRMDAVAAMLGTDRESLMKMFSGKMSLSCAGSVEQMKPQFFSDGLVSTNYPGVYFWAKINDSNLCNSILLKLLESNAVKQSEGVYSMNEESYSPSMYMVLKGDDFYLSNDRNAVLSKLNNDDWKKVEDQTAASIAKSNPVAVYVDLDYRKYEEILKSTMGGSEMDLFEKLKSSVLSSFKHIRLTAQSDNVTELVLQMSEEKKNGLQRIIVLMDEAYRIAN